MFFKRLFNACLLSLGFLQASLCICCDSKEPFNPKVLEYADHVKADAINTVVQIRSIDPEDQTFENFVFPWYRVRSKILSEADGSERLQEILIEADPHGLLPASLKDYSDRYEGLLNDFQTYILGNIQSIPQLSVQKLIYVSECAEECNGSQDEEVKMGDLSVLHTSTLPRGQNLDESLLKIQESDSDLLCIQGVTDEETIHRLYDQLRSTYRYFCIEEPCSNNSSAFIASKYPLLNIEDAFLDDKGIFVEVDVLDAQGEIARVLLV